MEWEKDFLSYMVYDSIEKFLMGQVILWPKKYDKI